MGKLKWVTKSVSFSCQEPPKFTKSVSPFSLTRFGAAEELAPEGEPTWVTRLIASAGEPPVVMQERTFLQILLYYIYVCVHIYIYIYI